MKRVWTLRVTGSNTVEIQSDLSALPLRHTGSSASIWQFVGSEEQVCHVKNAAESAGCRVEVFS